jgi:hypothetical protein
MQSAAKTQSAQSAAQKMDTGALLTLSEVAALLDLSPATVHGLPLPSIRLGRGLRFDPKDVKHLIETSKEAPIVI